MKTLIIKMMLLGLIMQFTPTIHASINHESIIMIDNNSDKDKLMDKYVWLDRKVSQSKSVKAIKEMISNQGHTYLMMQKGDKVELYTERGNLYSTFSSEADCKKVCRLKEGNLKWTNS